MFVFLYPQSYLESGKVDEQFSDEYELLKKEGLEVGIFSTEDVSSINEYFVKDKTVIYRGWMLTLSEYEAYQNKISELGGKVLTNLEQYKKAHHLPEWVESLQDLTPITHVFHNQTAALEFSDHHDGHKYFVKDFVKSLKVEMGSIISSKVELEGWLEEAEYYRGGIEGGLCLREVENFKEETELRFFVLNNSIFSNGVKIPSIVCDVVSRIKLPFFTVDVVLNKDDEWRVVEIGDGQVSDSSKWDLKHFPRIFKSPTLKNC